ncbi:MAG TPA: HypC/HybG/HupF family hydrogenase formation chaperone [Noviherbaspirillum sp.]
MAIPSRIVALDGDMATVEAFGKQRHVSLLLMQQPLQLGDYLLIQAGGFAYEKVEQEAALETLAVLQDIVGQAAA